MNFNDPDYEIVSEIGSRKEMEDRHVFLVDDNCKWIFGGVYDGHRNEKAAEHVSRHLHETFFSMQKSLSNPLEAFQFAYKLTDDEIIMRSGTCAANFQIINDTIFCANVGDSEIVVVGDGVKVLTEVHRAEVEKEKERIVYSEEGRIYKEEYVLTPTGEGLMVSRSLGDHDFRKSGVIAIPHLGSYQILPTDKYLVAGTDGLFDLASYEDVLDWSRNNNNPKEIGDTIKEEIFEFMSKGGRSDNFTVIILDLRS